MKITCISDTHGRHRDVNIKPTELLLFAGDSMTSGWDKEELEDFLQWFDVQPAEHKIMIAGNHCRFIENHPEEFRKMLEKFEGITYLEDESVEIRGFKIYGTPHSKIFCNWAFNRSEEKLVELFSKIPWDTDILVSHAPQKGVLDSLIDSREVGEHTLSDKIKGLPRLKLHVFGHIHNGFGMIKPHGKHISVNASQVNEAYDLTNFPIRLDL